MEDFWWEQGTHFWVLHISKDMSNLRENNSKDRRPRNHTN